MGGGVWLLSAIASASRVMHRCPWTTHGAVKSPKEPALRDDEGKRQVLTEPIIVCPCPSAGGEPLRCVCADRQRDVKRDVHGADCTWSVGVRFKAFVAIGDSNGHVGLGVKCSKEVATAIRGAIIMAKLSIIPVRRGFWGNKIGKPHTVPTKVTGKCGSIWVRLIPAPRGTGIVSAPVPKKLLQMAGIEDCCTSARGSTGTLGNFAKATYAAIAKTYSYLTPDLWKETVFTKSPYQEFTDFLAKNHRPTGTQAQKQETKQY